MALITDTTWAVPTLLDFALGFALWSQSQGDLYSVEVKTQGFVTNATTVRLRHSGCLLACPPAHALMTWMTLDLCSNPVASHDVAGCRCK